MKLPIQIIIVIVIIITLVLGILCCGIMGVQSSTQWPRSWSFMGNRSNDREQDDNLASQRLLTIPENAVVVTFENPYYNSVNNDISYDKHKKNMIGYEYNLEEYE